jgi:hypothetical protein
MQQQPDLIEPAAEIAFPQSGFIQAAFGRDSSTLIVQTDENAINLFGLGVHFWPEILGGLTFLLVLWALLRWWRASRTPRLAGQPHCRRCGYCLTGLTEDRCPECGTPPSKRRPIIGRSLKRRVGPLLTLACIAALGYGALWAFQVPRGGYINRLISIWSPEWYEAARQRNATFLDRIILQHGGSTIRLAEYDAASGKERRLIRHLRGATLSDCLAISSAGNVAWTTSDSQTKLSVLSVADGSILREFALPSRFQGVATWHQIAGIQPDGTTAIAVIHDKALDKSVIVAADRTTGDVTVLFEVDAAVSAGSGANRPVPGKFSLVPGNGPLRLVEARDASVRKPDEPLKRDLHAILLLHEFRDGHLTSREFPDCFIMPDAPAFTADGRCALIQTKFDSARPVRWDLQSLEPVGYQSSGFSRGSMQWTRPRTDTRGARPQFRMAPFGGIAYCSAQQRSYSVQVTRDRDRKFQIGVYGEQSEAWIQTCRFPYGMPPRALRVSPDGRRLVAETTIQSPRNTLESRLILYHLP